MKLVDRSRSTLAILVGALTLAMVAPACGDDDDDIGGSRGGTAGSSGKGGGSTAGGSGGAKGGTTGTSGGRGGTAGTHAGGSEAMAGGGAGGETGGTTGETGGTVSTEGGMTSQGGAPVVVEGGMGGVGTVGEGGAPMGTAGEGGAIDMGGTTGEGGAIGMAGGGGVAAEGGAGGGGGEGGGTSALTCNDFGCMTLFVPFAASGTQYFVSFFSAAQDLSNATITARVRARDLTGTAGHVELLVNDGSGFDPKQVQAEFSALGDWTDLTLSFASDNPENFDPTSVGGIQLHFWAAETVTENVTVDVDYIRIENGDNDINYEFTNSLDNWTANPYAGTEVAGSTIGLIPVTGG